MATDKELRSILAPLLARYPGWRYARGWFFCMPIGYYLRGIAFQGSWSSREGYMIRRAVYPMFDFVPHVHSGWTMSCPIPGTTNHGWNIFHGDLTEALADVMERSIVPVVANVVKGSDFLRYLNENYTMHGWQNTGRALAFIHMGELSKARALIAEDANLIRTRFPQLNVPGIWGHNLIEMLQLIDERPSMVAAYCEAAAQKSAQVNKLSKFWEPKPFLYEKTQQQ